MWGLQGCTLGGFWSEGAMGAQGAEGAEGVEGVEDIVALWLYGASEQNVGLNG